MHNAEGVHNDPDLVASKDVCLELDINRSTLTRWVDQDPPRITPAFRLPGERGAFVFYRADVDVLKAEIAAQHHRPEDVPA